MAKRPDDAAIMHQYRLNMNLVMAVLTEMFPDAGLCLFLFDQKTSQPTANYISNSPREQTLAAIKEWVIRQEGK